jgi:hypothetical protein
MMKRHDFYVFFLILFRVSVSRRERWEGMLHCEGEQKWIQSFVRKSERKRRLGRPRHRWKDNIKIDLKNKWKGVHWISLTDDRASSGLLRNSYLSIKDPVLWC